MQEEARNPEGNDATVAMNAAAENATEATLEEKSAAHEHYLIQLLQGFEVAGHAVNRLERFTFAMVKVLIEKEIIDFPKFEAIMEDVTSHEDLLNFWGIEKTPEAEESVAPTQEETEVVE